MKQEVSEQYVYIYLDQREKGVWFYKNVVFEYRPIYVGIGKGARMNCHVSPSELAQNSLKSEIFRAIIKETGEKPIRYKIFEDLTLNEAIEFEVDIIKTFGRISVDGGLLANIDKGGKKGAVGNRVGSNQRPVIQKSLNNEFIQRWPSIVEASQSLGINRTSLSGCCSGKYQTSGGFLWEYEGLPKQRQRTKKRISFKFYKYSIDGDFICSYDNISLASSDTGIKKVQIYAACEKKSRQTGGFQWFAEFQGDKIGSIKIQDRTKAILERSKPIQLFSDQNELIAEYPSIKVAAQKNGIAPAKIGRDLKRGERMEGGYWKVKEKKLF